MHHPSRFTKPLIGSAMILATALPACAQFDYKNWSSSFGGSFYNFSNTSAAGTISGSSPVPGFASQGGSFGMPTAIQPGLVFTNEFQIHGINGLNTSMDFFFSSGYGWGTGGQMILGNIHNYYEYKISAWDYSANPINVNSWNTITEYPSTAPGTSGYFSTSTTSRSAAGNSSLFYVFDPSADANFGQGGVVLLGGLTNVAHLQVTLTNSALAPNAQQVDFIIMNVGTPVPEPATLLGLAGATGLVFWRRRNRMKKAGR
jgi:hypothetical protein